jgi:hypothetical protein
MKKPLFAKKKELWKNLFISIEIVRVRKEQE